MRYRHDGNGGAITAASAAEAARRLARRHFGSQGQVESLRMVARSWQPNGWGGGSICGKVWRAVIILAPTAEQRYTGVGYTRQQRVILMVEGRVRACDMPAPEWPSNETAAAGSAMAAAAAAAAAEEARQWRERRHLRWQRAAQRARAALG